MLENISEIKHKHTYMQTAVNIAQDSHCERLKVGCVVVKLNNIIAHGCNGSLPGRDNCCEINNVTKPEVMHAEVCAIAKMTALGINSSNASVFVTTLPCPVCATLLCTSQIKEVYYLNEYRDNSGIEIFKSQRVSLHQMSVDETGKFIVTKTH